MGLCTKIYRNVRQSFSLIARTGIIALGLIPAEASPQQVKITGGAYVKNHAANVVVNGRMVNAGTLSNNGSGTIRLTGDWVNNGTYNASSETVFFLGTSVQEISGTSTTGFHNLTIDNTSGVSAGADLAVGGVLNLQTPNPSATAGTLALDGDTLHMGDTAVTTGAGEVSGIVSRSAFIGGTEYSFGSPFTSLTFSPGGTLPSRVSFNIRPGMAPSWKSDAIERTYDIIQVGGSNSPATLRLHYLDSELNGNPESGLVPWDYRSTPGPITVKPQPKSGGSTTNDWVSTSDIDIGYFPSSFDVHQWSLSRSIYVTFDGRMGWRMIASPNPVTYSELLSGFITQGMTGSTYPSKQPNFLWFDETDTLTTNSSWRTESSLADSTKGGRGFYLYVFDSISGTACDTLPKIMTATGNGYFPGIFSYSGMNQPVTYSPRTGIQTSSGPSDTIYYDINTADQGWNLLGNPTQYSLDWDASGWTKTNLDNSIYIWDPDGNEFKVWNGITGTLGNGLISPFQGFWVKANHSAPALSFSSEALTTGGSFYGGGSAKKNGAPSSAPSTMDLSLNAGGLHSTVMLSFLEGAKCGPDVYDAYRLEPLSDSFLELFTLSSTAHSLPLVINNLPPDGPDLIIIPLFAGGQWKGQELQGTFTLNWSLPDDWPDDWAISLQDHTLQKSLSMRRFNEYEFIRAQTKSAVSKSDPEDGVPSLPPRLVNPAGTSPRLKSSASTMPFSIVIRKNSPRDTIGYIAMQPQLIQNYPNPFSFATNISFTLPFRADVQILLYDMSGRFVSTITDKPYEAGIYRIEWQRGGIQPGLYFACMKAAGTTKVIKLVISD